jgi:hypothetical protein
MLIGMHADGLPGESAVEEDIKSLRKENRRLQRKLASLESWIERTGNGLRGMLERRGLRVHRRVPSDRFLVHPGLNSEEKDRIYKLMQRYSFRLLLRDVIRFKDGFMPQDLTRYCSLRAATGYVTSLQRLGLVEQDPSGLWSLRRTTVTSFGETLEWFVAEVFKRDFSAQAIHSVSFRTRAPGGDFDVIACMEGLLVYLEAKASPPRGIEAEEVSGFLNRRDILLPHMALFLVDTHLRMWDKMVPILEELAGGVSRDSGQPLERVCRLHGEIFHLDHSVYVLNSSPRVVDNLRRCLVDFLRYGIAIRERCSRWQCC